MNTFSKRHGFRQTEKEITTREDAPIGLREFIVQLTYELGYGPSFVRATICRVLRVSPNLNNWNEDTYIEMEVQGLIKKCEWYWVYDIIEALWKRLDFLKEDTFSEEVNDYFKRNGIGWKLENGLIEIRGDEAFEKSIAHVSSILEAANLPTAKSEIKEAINDLSRRPHPDITGAIQHALASLECVCREVSGDKKATLGELMKKYPNIVPKPLDNAIEKIWGFTSEQGRHLREGKQPGYLEAELIVELTASITIYLGKKLIGAKAEEIKEV